MYTHRIKSSNQLCYPAIWWPSADPSAGHHEKAYPLMVFESGQINRVREDNLEKIK